MIKNLLCISLPPKNPDKPGISGDFILPGRKTENFREFRNELKKRGFYVHAAKVGGYADWGMSCQNAVFAS